MRRQEPVIYATAAAAWAAVLWLGAGSMVHAAEPVPMEPQAPVFCTNPAEIEEISLDTTTDEPMLTPETVNAYQQVWDEASDYEKDLVARILALEAQGEPYEGERAVVEVILNRVISPEWPDTIYDVLSQRGQFAAWKYLDRPYNVPTISEYQLIEDTVLAGPEILPEGYVYFATSKVNGSGFIRIKNHYFSK